MATQPPLRTGSPASPAPGGTRQPGWPAAPGYLDAASIGVPPVATVTALHAELDRWAAGRARAPEYDADVSAARAAYARLVDMPPEQVAVGPQVSSLVASVASAVPDGARVVTLPEDFTSVIAPFEAQGDRGVTVEAVAPEALAETVSRGADAVAVSLVQSRDGSLLDRAALRAAARSTGALTLVDVTQAVGWLPVVADDWDVTVCGAYKWLCSPRGTAFLTARPEVLDRLRPVAAGWYAGEDRWQSIYGTGMTLAGDARRLDVSPAWLSWVGTRVSLGELAAVPAAVRRDHGAGLADLLRAGLDLAPAGRPIVSLPDEDGDLAGRLAAAGCRVSSRAGRLRLSYHLWNDPSDVELALDTLRPAWDPRRGT